ncbi:MAG TPA: TetR/AcrR family transcriptional regulator [Candidatus Acidoferrum sp.]|nr:TetR/AcrR family transcriptional regulator [Candidatus Acidoferrum sp.]
MSPSRVAVAASGPRKRAPVRLARPEAAGAAETLGLRERKKARLRQQIIETSIRLFRKQGYENTRVEDIVQILEISQPTFFRYFPSKDAVLREVGRRGFSCIKEHLETELSSDATTKDRLKRMYDGMAREVESDRPLWRAVVLSGAMDPVRSPQIRIPKEIAVSLLRDILEHGQKRGEVTQEFPVGYLAEFMEGLYTTGVRRWAVESPGPQSLVERTRSAVDFFLKGAQP